MGPRPFLPFLLFPICCLARSSLLHHWPLDESAGAIAADVAGNSPGTLQGACAWQPNGGHHAGALHFNGTGARVDLGPCDITTGSGDAITLACWAHPDFASSNEKVLLAKVIGNTTADVIWSLSVVNVSAVRFRMRAGPSTIVLTSSPTSLLTGTWYHLAATYDGNLMTIYVNGTPVGSLAASGLIGYHPQAPATMGSLADGPLSFFGSLDDVRIYDRAIDQSEVVQLVISDLVTGTPGPAPPHITEWGTLVPPPLSAPLMVEVCDILGRTEDRVLFPPNSGTHALGDLPRGCHLVRCSSSGRSWVLRYLVP
ncbi:MAG: LamG domain-containing protein [Flavobacteriales bacterium]|nr:LamG domain-containing protein [Flavobacteriales bacterium]